ncbi:hypothetical protein FB451DRAFT_1454241 [Mycena latifolia]|nr:hypothetical protein FB451DRAFT_1454241 [Mycena latifolia]
MKIIQLTALLASFTAAVLASPSVLQRSAALEPVSTPCRCFTFTVALNVTRSRADAPPPWSARAHTKWRVVRPRESSPIDTGAELDRSNVIQGMLWARAAPIADKTLKTPFIFTMDDRLASSSLKILPRTGTEIAESQPAIRTY